MNRPKRPDPDGDETTIDLAREASGTAEAQSRGSAKTERFPRRYARIATLLLFVLCVVVPTWLVESSRSGGPGDLMGLVNSVIIFGLAYVLLRAFRHAVHHDFKHRVSSTRVWAVVFISPAVLIGGYFTYRALPASRARAILAYADLARLPPSARHVRSYRWSSPMSGEKFLRFAASAEDIERFLQESPILRGKKCERYSAERMRLPYPDDFGREEHFTGSTVYFTPSLTAPSWYREEVRGRGRRYEIQPEGDHYPGEVLIDDEEHVVYVHLMFS
jgi:hypothetical protein